MLTLLSWRGTIVLQSENGQLVDGGEPGQVHGMLLRSSVYKLDFLSESKLKTFR